MNKRAARIKTIRKIILESRISSQEQLIDQLAYAGVSVTQATLSRDLKDLKVVKIPEPQGEYHYAFTGLSDTSFSSCVEDFRRGYVSLAFSSNIAVIKTLAGHADVVAAALDQLDFPELLGTIAGDDTVLAILSHESRQQSFLEKLTDIMGELEIE